MRNLLTIGCLITLSALFLMIGGCSSTDGSPFSVDKLNHQTCTTSSECAPNGYCELDLGGIGYCMTECTVGAQGDTMCSNYIGKGFECVNTRCLKVCTADADCDSDSYCAALPPDTLPQHLGRSHCRPKCKSNTECTIHNPAYTCAEGHCVAGIVDGDEVVGGDCDYWTAEEAQDHTFPDNYSDKDCVLQGYEWTCQSDNKCHTNGKVDVGTIDETKNAASWVKDGGVWAGIYTTPATTIGLPIVNQQDTVSEHNLLIRFKQEGDKVVMTTKICRIFIWNYKGDSCNLDLARMQTPALYYNNVPMGLNEILNPPVFAKGAKFVTTPFIEVRGTTLKNPHCGTDEKGNLTFDSGNRPVVCDGDLDEGLAQNAPGSHCCAEALPDRTAVCKYMEEHDSSWVADGDYDCPLTPNAPFLYDQDNDGLPAMTSQMVGVLKGDVFSVQRYQYYYDGEVVDKDHLKGILYTFNEQYQIGASKSSLLGSTQSVPYDYATKDGPTAPRDRAYFRLMRVKDDFTCEDVLNENAKPESYIHMTLHLSGVPDPGTVDGDYELGANCDQGGDQD